MNLPSFYKSQSANLARFTPKYNYALWCKSVDFGAQTHHHAKAEFLREKEIVEKEITLQKKEIAL